jgi:hypothetical protein
MYFATTGVRTLIDMIKHNTLKWGYRYYWFFIDGMNLERPLGGRGGINEVINNPESKYLDRISQ